MIPLRLPTSSPTSIPKIITSLNNRLRFNTLCLRSPSRILDRPLGAYFDLPLLYVFVFKKLRNPSTIFFVGAY